MRSELLPSVSSSKFMGWLTQLNPQTTAGQGLRSTSVETSSPTRCVLQPPTSKSAQQYPPAHHMLPTPQGPRRTRDVLAEPRVG